MIKITSMNHQSFILNDSLIYRIESTPDTIIILTDGKSLMVKETPEQVVNKIITYQQAIRAESIRSKFQDE